MRMYIETLLFTAIALLLWNKETVSLIFVIKVTPFENLNNTHKLFMQIKGALNKLALCVETGRNVNIEEAADDGRGEKKSKWAFPNFLCE